MDRQGAALRQSLARPIATFGLILTVAACAAQAAPPPAPTAAPSASAQAGASPSAVPLTSEAQTEEPSPYESVEPYPALEPPIPDGRMPQVSPVRAGTWTGITWVALPSGAYPAVPSAEINYGPNYNLEGWSKGFVDFLWNPELRTLTPWVSGDGLRWRPGTRLNLGAWKSDFASWDGSLAEWAKEDPEAADPDDHYRCTVYVTDFEEGATGLVMQAYFDCAPMCGGSAFTSSTAMWASANGLSWTPIDIDRTFGSGGTGLISGGSSGFITLGTADHKSIAWTSRDGRTWTRSALPSDGSNYGAPVAIAGGFVLPGSVSIRKGHSGWYGAGCGSGGPQDTTKYQGALWTSSNGATWTRVSLTGTVGFGISMSVLRIDEHTVIADELTFYPDGSLYTEIQWGSHDGKSWTRLKAAPFAWATVLYSRQCGLIVEKPMDPQSPTRLWRVNDAFGMVALPQSGDVPWWGESRTVIGPTGLLSTNQDGSRFWIGVPTVR